MFDYSSLMKIGKEKSLELKLSESPDSIQKEIVRKDIKNKKSLKSICVILHDIRSAHNVGSVFRTCDAAGISTLYLCGYTPTPIDRFDRPRKDIGKVALGAEKTLPWKHEANTMQLIGQLKKDGYTIVAIEQHPNALDYKQVKIETFMGKTGKTKIAFLFGNEVDGVPDSLLQQCGLIAEIPMRGDKESLNVSVALGIALFHILGI
jgi:tRNA G18 (ribose-2'-O)-methylase SpoU